MLNWMNPSVSVWFKVSYENKDKFKKYRARWNPSSTELRFMKSWCMKITEEDNMGEWKKTHEMILTLNTELKNYSGGYLIAIEDTIGLLDKYDTFNIIFGKPREKSKWEMEQETAENLTVPSKCLIVDDEERHIPIATGPIDAYRGTGKVIVAEPKPITDWDFPTTEYIKSTECKYKCIPSQIGKGNTCICDDKHMKLNKQLTEVKMQMAPYNGSQYVGFGKFKTCKWENMCRDKDRKSWTEWYLKNGKKDLFYNYLVLLKEEDDLLYDIRSIERPFYD